MTWLVNVFYVLGFLVIAMILGIPFLKSLGSGIRSNEHFAELVLRGGFAAFALLLWFAFGDSILSWFFGLFFGSSEQSPTAASVGTSATFASHPFLWFGHLFAYVPIVAAMAASGIVSFLYNGNALIDYVLKAVFLSTVALVFYWHYDGMELLVSWFSWIRGTRKIPTPGKSGGFLLKKRGFRVYFPRYERRPSGYQPRVREIGMPKEEIRETGE